MKRKSNAPTSVFIRFLGVIALVIASTLVWFAARHDRGDKKISIAPTNSPASSVAVTNTNPAATGPVAAATNIAASTTTVQQPTATFSWFQTHPFKAAQTKGDYQWTEEDGKDTNVIRQLAHNALEYQRMVNENSTIHRRQLVYHEEAFTLQAQQAVQSGQTIQHVTLPGLDGQELQVQVTKTDIESGGDRGIFYGKLPDRPDSMVTVAFINAREAFTVISAKDNLFLQAEAREPGEIVVKSIDPSTYGGPMAH